MAQTLTPVNEIFNAVGVQWAGDGIGPKANLADFVNDLTDSDYITFNGIWNFTTNFSFQMSLAGASPGSFNGWILRIRYRWSGGVGLAVPGTLALSVGRLGSCINVGNQDSNSAPLVFTTGDFNISAVDAAALGPGISYQVLLEQTAGDDPFPAWDITKIELIIADGGVLPDIEITGDGGVEVNGTQLSWDIIGEGGVEVGGGIVGTNNLVLSVDASGIYTLIKDKSDDTLYQRDSSDETIDVKIPDPFVKTGYLGG